MSFKKAVFYIILVFIAVLFLRFPTVSADFYNMDEGIGAVAANTILDGGIYYRDAIDQRGPVTYYVYALVFKLFGRNNMSAVHCALIIVVLITSVFLYFIGVLIWDRKTACRAVLFFGLFSYSYSDKNMLAFHTEWCAVLFNTVGAYFFLKSQQVSSLRAEGEAISSFRFLRSIPLLGNDKLLAFVLVFLSGIFFSLAFLSKQPALFDFLAALLFFCIFTFIGKKNLSAVVKDSIYMITGFFLPLSIIILYYYLNNSLNDFWFYFWVYNIEYYAAVIPLPVRIKMAFAYLTAPKSFFRSNLLLSISFAAVFFTTIFDFIRKPKRIDKSLVDFYIVSWGLSAYIGASCTGRFYSHYFIMILPPFCLAGAKFTRDLFDSADFRFKSKYFKLASIKLFLIIVIVSGLMFPSTRYFKAASEEMKSRVNNRIIVSQSIFKDFKQFKKFPYHKKMMSLKDKELRALARYLKFNSGKKEKIFVWGFYPEIYVLSGLTPASRYTYCNFLTGLLPWSNTGREVDTSAAVVPGSWNIFMREMKKNMPLYIVDTSIGNHRYYGKYPVYKFKEFSNFIEENYKPEKVFFDTGKKASFLLFRRNDE